MTFIPDPAIPDPAIPDPTALHPLPDHPRVVLLKPLVDSPTIEVGEYTYYDDPDHATEFQTRNVLYGYGAEKLVIGRFRTLAAGTRFIMSGTPQAVESLARDHGLLNG